MKSRFLFFFPVPVHITHSHRLLAMPVSDFSRHLSFCPSKSNKIFSILIGGIVRLEHSHTSWQSAFARLKIGILYCVPLHRSSSPTNFNPKDELKSFIHVYWSQTNLGVSTPFVLVWHQQKEMICKYAFFSNVCEIWSRALDFYSCKVLPWLTRKQQDCASMQCGKQRFQPIGWSGVMCVCPSEV